MKKETKTKKNALLKQRTFLYKMIDNIFKCMLTMLSVDVINLIIMLFINESEQYRDVAVIICIITILIALFCLIPTACAALIEHKLKRL